MHAEMTHASDLLPDGCLHDSLVLTFKAKNVNIEIENNLARAANQRMVMRGKYHTAASMVSKHCSSEIKLGHMRLQAPESAAKPDATQGRIHYSDNCIFAKLQSIL